MPKKYSDELPEIVTEAGEKKITFSRYALVSGLVKRRAKYYTLQKAAGDQLMTRAEWDEKLKSLKNK